MRHFQFLSPSDEERLFYRAPQELSRDDDIERLAPALGATLYIPATRERLAADVVRVRALGAASCVICLEDAIPDSAVEFAVTHVAAELQRLQAQVEAGDVDDLPLIFVRVRAVDQPTHLIELMGKAAGILDGFVLPKFSAAQGADYIEAVAAAEEVAGRRLLVMPVIETPEIIHHESRLPELLGIEEVLAHYRDRVLAVRIGATDLASAFALRRPRDLTVYDIRLIASTVVDIVNVLGRPGNGYYVTGPVWEYFTSPDRLFKPLLRETPFGPDDRKLRARLLASDLDGLIREVVLDRANGLIGKTVIHPSHIPVVHSLSVVSHEEYDDALGVLATAEDGGGVSRSSYRNKMNEASPHLAWATRLLVRADAFGVAGPDVSFVDLLAASRAEDLL